MRPRRVTHSGVGSEDRAPPGAEGGVTLTYCSRLWANVCVEGVHSVPRRNRVAKANRMHENRNVKQSKGLEGPPVVFQTGRVRRTPETHGWCPRDRATRVGRCPEMGAGFRVPGPARRRLGRPSPGQGSSAAQPACARLSVGPLQKAGPRPASKVLLDSPMAQHLTSTSECSPLR